MEYDQIEIYRRTLNELGAEGVEGYAEKLNKAKGTLEFQDLLCEGYSAILLLLNGFSVTMQESPDLLIKFDDDILYAEVKHFRYKNQDRIDQENMERAMQQDEPMLVEIGKTKKPSSDEVFDTIKDKRDQFVESFANILIIESDSPNAINDSIMSTVTVQIGQIGANYPGMERLNGILLLASDYSRTNHCDVYFYRTENPAVPLSQEMVEKLDSLRQHRPIKGCLHKMIYGDKI